MMSNNQITQNRCAMSIIPELQSRVYNLSVKP